MEQKDKNNKLIRIFICISFPDEVLKELTRVQEVLGNAKFQGKLTEPENLHLTLKFLGEIDEEMINKVKKKLKEVKFAELSLRLGDSGMFNFHGNPRLVWVKIEGELIWELQKKIDAALQELFPSEERFMSHLTIARIKYVKDKKLFDERIKSLGVKKIDFKIDNFMLVKSDLKPTGPIYTLIEEYKLNQ